MVNHMYFLKKILGKAWRVCLSKPMYIKCKHSKLFHLRYHENRLFSGPFVPKIRCKTTRYVSKMQNWIYSRVIYLFGDFVGKNRFKITRRVSKI